MPAPPVVRASCPVPLFKQLRVLSQRYWAVSFWLLAGTCVPAQEDAAVLRQQAAAERLWQGFLTMYQRVSLEPLTPQTLDLKGREALLAVAGPSYRDWKAERAATLPDLFKAVRKADPTLKPFELMERLLGGLLPKIDRYGRYESVEEIELLDEAARQAKGVFAINLVIDEKKVLRCFPDPDGPAAKAGVLAGAELLEVDGVAVAQKSLAFVKMAFAGSKSVEVKVRQPQGRQESIVIERTFETFPSVSLQKSPAGVRVRIRTFDGGVADQLRELFKANQPIDRLTLDLRGNGGGLIQEAFAVAELFLPKGAVIAYVRGRDGDKTQVAATDPVVTPGSIQILLDHGTASASELLAMGLKENLTTRVVLRGQQSYGKGQRLSRDSLEGGGMLTLSDGLMLSPAKKSWDHTGITPDVEMK